MQRALILGLCTIVLSAAPADAAEALRAPVGRQLTQRNRALVQRVHEMFTTFNQGPLHVSEEVMERLQREIGKRPETLEDMAEEATEATGPARKARIQRIDGVLRSVEGLAQQDRLRRALAEQLVSPKVSSAMARLKFLNRRAFLEANLVRFGWEKGKTSPSVEDNVAFQVILRESHKVAALARHTFALELSLSADPNLRFLERITSPRAGLKAIGDRRAQLEAAVPRELEDTVVAYLQESAVGSLKAAALYEKMHGLEPRLATRQAELLALMSPTVDRAAVRRVLMTIGEASRVVRSLDSAEKILRGLAQVPIQ